MYPLLLFEYIEPSPSKKPLNIAFLNFSSNIGSSFELYVLFCIIPILIKSLTIFFDEIVNST